MLIANTGDWHFRGKDLADCVRWGSAVGASCVRSINATDGVFDREEAEDFLRDHPLKIETC